MKYILILFMNLNFMIFSVAANEDRFSKEELAEFEPFKDIVHPYLSKNCATCHSEDAVYPVGPGHSQSNKELAFLDFKKRIDLSNIANSKFPSLLNDFNF